MYVCLFESNHEKAGRVQSCEGTITPGSPRIFTCHLHLRQAWLSAQLLLLGLAAGVNVSYATCVNHILASINIS
jgi:hypothetical protein